MTMQTQSPVLIVTSIKPLQQEPLKDFLIQLNRALWQEKSNPFGSFNKQHFARWVAINDQLIFAASVDGDPEDYIKGLAAHCSQLLHDVYHHCDHYPNSNQPNDESIANFLLSHQVPTPMFYHGLRNRTVEDVQLESQIHKAIQSFLDGNQDSSEFRVKKPMEIYETIKAHLKGIGLDHKYSSKDFETRLSPELRANIWWRIPMLAAGLLLIILIMPVIVAVEWWERKNPSKQSPFIADSSPEQLDFEEIQAIQSPMTSIVAIKPGAFRMFTLRAVLWALQGFADYYYNKGRLGSIGSIHFARWAIINNGKHLLFISNYDGSWESYLGDFIDRAAVGLTAVWGNAVRFPPPVALVCGGAKHAAAFKTYAKRSQVATHFWYSAYPELSMPNKLNNRSIRNFLNNPKKRSAKRWLLRF